MGKSIFLPLKNKVKVKGQKLVTPFENPRRVPYHKKDWPQKSYRGKYVSQWKGASTCAGWEQLTLICLCRKTVCSLVFRGYKLELHCFPPLCFMPSRVPGKTSFFAALKSLLSQGTSQQLRGILVFLDILLLREQSAQKLLSNVQQLVRDRRQEFLALPMHQTCKTRSALEWWISTQMLNA